MLASKRGAFSNKKKITRSDGQSSISADQDIWNQLREDVASNLRRSVVSLVLNDACRIPCTFSGIAIECQNNVTKFVTTGILVSALKTGQFEEDIKVHYEGNVATGYLDEYDSDCQLAAVKVMSPLDIYCIHLNPGMESMPCKQLIVVGCVFDTLIATSGKISHRSKDRKFLILSRISEGVFRYVGMNGWYETRRGEHYFHPKGNRVLLNIAFTNLHKSIYRRSGLCIDHTMTTIGSLRRDEVLMGICDCCKFYLELDLNSLSYPIPSRSMVNRGIILVNTYEDPFCDLYPKGVWGEFRKRVSFYISQNVVALSSFKDSMVNDSTAVAVGWIFQSGALMVASGKLIVGSSMLDCEVLCYSTCKISKVGIGGSLVDVDGNFISMKFHEICYNCEKIGTLYVYSEDLCRILEFFKTKNYGDIVHGDEEAINKWPVPDPYWCDPSEVEEEDMNDKQELVADGCPVRYRFGSISVLK
ncbi:hypothetical protein SETIT_2G182600v2 [Setaria italica]|uniref:Uncharacterized protein n=1 Tax=Setaria italica TaxID=4555 RepID=A0A368Q2F2_SETIT|nr:hypothetical protein SETIT_2G182600v2 [Setaria italica]